MWVLLFVGLVIVILSLRKAIQLFSKNSLSEWQLETGLNAIIVWGIIGLAIGLFSQITGIYQALGAIIGASDISPRIVMQGIQASFIGPISGLFLFIMSAIIWLFLRTRYKLCSRHPGKFDSVHS